MKIIECPRDAMQGIREFIPTEIKINYINQLLKVGFDTIDVGSFVSSKSIPQLKDTSLVLEGLDLDFNSSKLLAIVANTRGALEACNFDQITYLGFPLSVSEKFQIRNTNKTINQALDIVEEIQDISIKNNKKLVVYLSMAFGNPYNELYHIDKVLSLTEKLNKLNVKIISLSDTVGVSIPDNISEIFRSLSFEYQSIEFGAHFHTTIESWKEKIDSAYNNGCRRFDSAIRGYGGCPMASDDLIGNMPTEKLISYFKHEVYLNHDEFLNSLKLADSIFL